MHDADLRDKIVACSIPDENGCWIWQKATDRDGYGRVTVSRKRFMAHRISYQAFIGEIPPGLVIDHFKCDTPPCVNPIHLRPTTNRENLLRGNGPTSRLAAVTHCPKGHEYTPNNTCRSKQGWRDCRTCRQNRKRNARAAKKKTIIDIALVQAPESRKGINGGNG